MWFENCTVSWGLQGWSGLTDSQTTKSGTSSICNAGEKTFKSLGTTVELCGGKD